MASEATYAAVSRSLEMNNMRFRSVKFVCNDKDVKDVDIVRALMVQCDVSEIESSPDARQHLGSRVFDRRNSRGGH